MDARTTRLSRVGGGAAVVLLAALTAGAADWTQNTPYYEEDAWYDITEWLDGNNYNPTDEAMWRWDDETYDLAQDVGQDADSDVWYGYTSRNDDDWFYDYYDPAYYADTDGDMLYQSGGRFIDYDNDGAYEAAAWYADRDGDGNYETYEYYSFGGESPGMGDQKAGKADMGKQAGDMARQAGKADTAKEAGAMAKEAGKAHMAAGHGQKMASAGTPEQQQRLRQQAPKQSREQTVTGQIEKTKQVQVRGDRHLVVQLKQDSQMIVADLGKASDVQSLQLSEGDTITIKGPRSQVGDNPVLLARTVESEGQTKTIDRQRKQMTGTVASTHRTKVRGAEHLIAMVNTTGQQAGKVAVDFGPASKTASVVSEGSSVTFTGVPIEVQDKKLILAQTVRSKDGKTIQIQPMLGTQPMKEKTS